MTTAIVILTVAGLYLGIGCLVGLGFAAMGAASIDAGARGAPLGFRVLILPGAIALWPLIAIRWRRAARSGGKEPHA